MKFAGNPNKEQPARSQHLIQQQIHSGEGSDSAWQALQQVARTKPRAGFLPIRSAVQELLSSTRTGA